MEIHSFLGPTTALTAAGVPPLGSVFNAVSTADQMLGRATTRILPPVQARASRRRSERAEWAFPMAAQPCGCGA